MNSSSLNLVSLIKALAAQLIVWHHLALYGPMSDVIWPSAMPLLDWLETYGRLAVQAFLVVAGFLAARGLRFGEDMGPEIRPWHLISQRYLRLMTPYVVALPLALAAAALARHLIQHPTIPEAASAGRLLAHLILAQDVLAIDALSAGVWYIAIDFQLYVILIFLAWRGRGQRMAWSVALMVLSLFWLNTLPQLDVWGIYFFGSYGLGVLAYWVSCQPRRLPGLCLLALLVAAALLVDWRLRILLAGSVALLLAATAGKLPLRWPLDGIVGYLDQTSYALFLVHYPVCLAVGAVVHFHWQQDASANALGMLVGWLVSLLAAGVLYRFAGEAWRGKPAAAA